jgi:hypothetical protein
LYGLTGEEFVLSMSALYKVFTSYYLSEYSTNEMIDPGDNISLLLPIKQNLTRLENDLRTKLSIKAVDSRTESQLLEDLFVTTSSTELGSAIWTTFQTYKELLKEQDQIKETMMKDIDEQAYNTARQDYEQLRMKISQFKQSEAFKLASQYIVDYYGNNSITNKPNDPTNI